MAHTSYALRGMIFVFGSNTAGIHGAGAARYAYMERGAEWGIGIGRTGQCYAIPTKDRNLQSLSLPEIHTYVDSFMKYARKNPTLEFQVTCIGCGLAGFRNDQIAPMFNTAPGNCWFDIKWESFLPQARMWGMG